METESNTLTKLINAPINAIWVLIQKSAGV